MWCSCIRYSECKCYRVMETSSHLSKDKLLGQAMCHPSEGRVWKYEVKLKLQRRVQDIREARNMEYLLRKAIKKWLKPSQERGQVAYKWQDHKGGPAPVEFTWPQQVLQMPNMEPWDIPVIPSSLQSCSFILWPLSSLWDIYILCAIVPWTYVTCLFFIYRGSQIIPCLESQKRLRPWMFKQ
jgi:hypothetical protein